MAPMSAVTTRVSPASATTSEVDRTLRLPQCCPIGQWQLQKQAANSLWCFLQSGRPTRNQSRRWSKEAVLQPEADRHYHQCRRGRSLWSAVPSEAKRQKLMKAY